jgi:hypothetical protein
MSAASQEARAGAERRRWFAAASAAVERRQASAPAGRAPRPLLCPPPHAGRMKVAGAEVGHTRLSAFRLPDFMRRARSRWMPVPPPAPSDGIGSGAFRFSWSKTRVRTRRGNTSSLRAPAKPVIGPATSGGTHWLLAISGKSKAIGCAGRMLEPCQQCLAG